LGLAYRALALGGTAGCVLNAADEVAVEAFLELKIPFPAIPKVVEGALEQARIGQPRSVDDVLVADQEARALARTLVESAAVSVGS
jgi:1-deoxy-D-xylulose-5-phosphate reductoisomerase